MPETFDLDDEPYDPLGGKRPDAPPSPPSAEAPPGRAPSRSLNSEAPDATQQRPSSSQARPPSAANVPPAPGRVAPPTGNIPPASGRVAPPTGNIPPASGRVAPPSARPPSGTGAVGGSPNRPAGSVHPTGSVPSRASRPLTGGATSGPVSGEDTGGASSAGAGTAPGAQVGVPPHSKASDLLRGHPNYKAQDGDGHSLLPILTAERGNTRFDDFARWLLTIAGLVALAALGYYVWGICSGSLAKETYGVLSHDDKARILQNLDNVHMVMTYSLLVAVAAMIFLFYDEGTAAYALVGLAIFLQVLFPILVTQFFALDKLAPSDASNHLCANASDVAWIPGIPGIVLIVMEIARKFITGLEEQRFKRKHLQYGKGVLKADKTRNVFLGNCWSLPFCRENVRARCPIFLRRRGPCWRTKRGCMCDESIVLAASGGDWKKSVAQAQDQIDNSPAGKIRARVAAEPTPRVAAQNLSTAFKRERCRQCVIYNYHQEQKYKALVFLAFVGVAAAFYFYSDLLITWVSWGYHHLDQVAQTYRFDPQAAPQHTTSGKTLPSQEPSMVSAAADLSLPVSWVVLIIVTMILLSKVLQAIEYACFKLKI